MLNGEGSEEHNPKCMRRFVPITLAVIGLLVLVPGVFLLIFIPTGLNPADEAVALAPLTSIPLDRVENQLSTEVKVVIPYTAQWTRIRAEWGKPEFIVSAVSSEHLLAWCLAELRIEIKVSHHGNLVPAAVSYPPYGYSGCENGSLRFGVDPGTDELRLSISKSGFLPLPSGRIIIVADWRDTKGNLVGDSLDAGLRPLAIAASLAGVILIALAAFFQWRRVSR